MNGTYRVSDSVLIQIGSAGELIASVSVSKDAWPLEVKALHVLRCFGRPVTVQKGFEGLSSDAMMSYVAFERAAQSLLESNLLVHTGGAKRAVRGGFASLEAHQWMLRDYTRVMAYRTAISKYVRDKVVVEIGCGTGVLSIFAALAGAKKVYAIEETGIGEVAADMIEANGVSGTVQLLSGNSRDVELPEKADVLIHELLGTDPYVENMVPSVRDAKKRFLKPGAKLLPESVDVCCVGVEAPYAPQMRERLMLESAEFDRMYGLKFEPFRQSMNQMFDITPVGSVFPAYRDSSLGQGMFRGKILTKETLLRSLDLNGTLDRTTETEITAKLNIHSDGLLGALLVFFRAHFDRELSLSTSPFTPWTHWGWPMRELSKAVNGRAGEVVSVVSYLLPVAGKESLFVDLSS